jgi:hypothetical protein
VAQGSLVIHISYICMSWIEDLAVVFNNACLPRLETLSDVGDGRRARA